MKKEIFQKTILSIILLMVVLIYVIWFRSPANILMRSNSGLYEYKKIGDKTFYKYSGDTVFFPIDSFPKN